MQCLLPLFSLLLIFNSGVSADQKPSVIIIGAGPAGIAAATKLLENSITNLKILEAEDRIGGRINSVKIGNDFVDLGAQFCHGKENNVVYELAKDILVDEPFNVDHTVFYSDGSKLEPELSEDIVHSVLEYEEFGKDSKFNETGLSIGESFLIRYNASVLPKYSNSPKNLKAAKEAIPLAENLILLNEGAFSWSTVSAVKHWEDSEGSKTLSWKKEHGYRIFLDILMKKFPDSTKQLSIDDKIFLNKQVTEINWSNSNGTSVKTSDNVIHQADYVIFTPSLGVLKHSQNLFQPQLPSEKQQAIKGLSFDGIMKIIMHFPNQWWNETDTAFTLLWSEEDKKKILDEFKQGPSKNGISWVTSIGAIVPVSAPNILMAWVGGEMVPEIEKLPDNIIKSGVMYIFNKFLGNKYNITEPDILIKSNWCTNPNFLGTYSYDNVEYYNNSINYHEELARPLIDGNGKVLLQFAGEATSPTHYATVHGAVESGFREAERILKLIKTTQI